MRIGVSDVLALDGLVLRGEELGKAGWVTLGGFGLGADGRSVAVV